MTFQKQAFRIGTLTLTSLALAGCLGGSGTGTGGGGGAGGGAGGATDFDAAFEAVQLTAPTQTALTSMATYNGEVSVRTDANTSLTDERVFGDLAMTIDFGGGADPISATVNNLAGEINGVQTSIGGELSTANATNQVNAVTATTLNIPGVGSSTITGMSVGLEGTLTDPTNTLSGEALMTLQGNFVGTDGAAVFGATSVGIRPASGADIITGGTFYAEK